MRTSPLTRRSRTLLAVVLSAVAAVVSGCGAGGEATLPAPKESNERPAVDDIGDGDGQGSEYCDAVADFMTSDDPGLQDPAKAVEALATLGEVAPDELKPSFEVLAGVVGELQGLDDSDPDYITRSLEVVLDPAVQDAADRIDEFTMQECGVDLQGSVDLSADDPSADDQASDDRAGDIDLEHIDEVRDANSSASWSAKLTTTTIMNDETVTLSADPSDPVTVDEAMTACEAVRTALVSINAQVTVEILNGEVGVAASPAGGTCAPS